MKTDEQMSKFLSFVLRHKPEAVGIQLDTEGWADVQLLLFACENNGNRTTTEQLRRVATRDKQRFAFSEDGLKIRANQGHSVRYVKVPYAEAVPPQFLYHGTATRNVASIENIGLLKRDRHHVHLTESVQTSLEVGRRYGEPVVIRIITRPMLEAGTKFYLSDNKVWLVDYVPASCLHSLEQEDLDRILKPKAQMKTGPVGPVVQARFAD